MYDIPITFFIYKRFKKTQYIFDQIRKIKPKFLFIIADGPKNKNEQYACKKTRDIIKQIDWDCDLQTCFSDVNLGLNKRFFSGFEWLFERVEESIILEDDTLPHDYFFEFCKDLLIKYKNNPKIGIISGSNLGVEVDQNTSYSFSHMAFIWGWATWKRTWNLIDKDMNNLDNFIKEKKIDSFSFSAKAKSKIIKNFYDIRDNKVNTWDTQFLFSLLDNQLLNVIPHFNLIKNIGFDSDATHTLNRLSYFNMIKFGNIKKTITPPKKIQLNESFQNKIMKIFTLNKFEELLFILKNFICHIFHKPKS